MSDKPTNSQIDAAVHEALGLHDDSKMCAGGTELLPCLIDKNNPQYEPGECNHIEKGKTWDTCKGRYSFTAPLYTTDPGLFWPLLYELLEYFDKFDYRPRSHINASGGGELYIYIHDEDGDREIEDVPGRAVCLAWLEMKGVKVNG